MSKPRYGTAAHYLALGWRFVYEPDTRFIALTHPDGGQRSVVQFYEHIGDDFGHKLAEMMNNAEPTS